MSCNLYHLPLNGNSPLTVNAIIEIPKNTNVKYEYDPDLGVFLYDRSLLSAMVYPASYGFIPSTLADDGDALDILIYNSHPIATGTLVECKVLGVLDMTDDGAKDYKILSIPTTHSLKYQSLTDIDPQFLRICKNFFAHYKDLDDKKVEVGDWGNAELAYQIINDSIKKP